VKGVVLAQIEVDDEAFEDISTITYIRRLFDQLASDRACGFESSIYSYLDYLEKVCTSEYTPHLDQDAISKLHRVVQKLSPSLESRNRENAIIELRAAVLKQMDR